MKKIYAVLGLIFMLPQVNASYFRTLDYDEVRKEGGFQSKTLLNVEEIISSEEGGLTEEEKKHILSSQHLSNLRTLSFENQGIDDEFVFSLCNNPALRRIMNLNLSRNLALTNASIQAILESDILGSVRDTPQISARFDVPSSVIYIKAEETGIENPEGQSKSFKVHRFNFSIRYLHPVEHRETSPPVNNAVKFLDVILSFPTVSSLKDEKPYDIQSNGTLTIYNLGRATQQLLNEGNKWKEDIPRPNAVEYIFQGFQDVDTKHINRWMLANFQLKLVPKRSKDLVRQSPKEEKKG